MDEVNVRQSVFRAGSRLGKGDPPSGVGKCHSRCIHPGVVVDHALCG